MAKKAVSSVESIILDEIKELRTDIKEIVKKVERLEVKSSIWGGITGIFGGFIAMFIQPR